MVKRKIFTLFLFIILILNFINAELNVGVIDNGNIGINLIPEEPLFNNNTGNVNNSYWLRGLSPQEVADLYVETDPIWTASIPNVAFTNISETFDYNLDVTKNLSAYDNNFFAGYETLPDTDFGIDFEGYGFDMKGSMGRSIYGVYANITDFIDQAFFGGGFLTEDVYASVLVFEKNSNWLAGFEGELQKDLLSEMIFIDHNDTGRYIRGTISGDEWALGSNTGEIYAKGYTPDLYAWGDAENTFSYVFVGNSPYGLQQGFSKGAYFGLGEEYNLTMFDGYIELQNDCLILNDETYVCTSADLGDSSWNKSYADTLYRPINHPTELGSSNVTGILTTNKGGTGWDTSGFGDNSLLRFENSDQTFREITNVNNAVLVTDGSGNPSLSSAKYSTWDSKYGGGENALFTTVNTTSWIYSQNNIYASQDIIAYDDLQATDDLFIGDQLNIGEYTKGDNYANAMRMGKTKNSVWGEHFVQWKFFESAPLRSDTGTKLFQIYANGTGNASSGSVWGLDLRNDVDYIGSGQVVGINVALGGSHNAEEIGLYIDSSNISMLYRGLLIGGRDPITYPERMPQISWSGGAYFKGGVEFNNIWTTSLIKSYQDSLDDPIWEFYANDSASSESIMEFFIGENYTRQFGQMKFGQNFSLEGNRRATDSADFTWFQGNGAPKQAPGISVGANFFHLDVSTSTAYFGENTGGTDYPVVVEHLGNYSLDGNMVIEGNLNVTGCIIYNSNTTLGACT